MLACRGPLSFPVCFILLCVLSSPPPRAAAIGHAEQEGAPETTPENDPRAVDLTEEELLALARSSVFEVEIDCKVKHFRRLAQGFVVGSDGTAVMSLDALRSAKRVTARSVDGRRLDLRIVDALPEDDIALVRLDVEGKAVPSIRVVPGGEHEILDGWTFARTEADDPNSLRPVRNSDLMLEDDGGSVLASSGVLRHALGGSPIVNGRGVLIGRWCRAIPGASIADCIQATTFADSLVARLEKQGDAKVINGGAVAKYVAGSVALTLPVLRCEEIDRNALTGDLRKLDNCICSKCEGHGFVLEEENRGAGKNKKTTYTKKPCDRLIGVADQFAGAAQKLARTTRRHRQESLPLLSERVRQIAGVDLDSMKRELRDRARLDCLDAIPGTGVALVFPEGSGHRDEGSWRVRWEDFRFLLPDPCLAAGGEGHELALLGVISGSLTEDGTRWIVVDQAVLVPLD